MPRIVYAGPHRAVVLDGVECRQGEAVAFPAAVCKSVLQQSSWIEAAKYKPATDEPDHSHTEEG